MKVKEPRYAPIRYDHAQTSQPPPLAVIYVVHPPPPRKTINPSANHAFNTIARRYTPRPCSFSTSQRPCLGRGVLCVELVWWFGTRALAVCFGHNSTTPDRASSADDDRTRILLSGFYLSRDGGLDAAQPSRGCVVWQLPADVDHQMFHTWRLGGRNHWVGCCSYTCGGVSWLARDR
jgi:hypothetical protein